VSLSLKTSLKIHAASAACEEETKVGKKLYIGNLGYEVTQQDLEGLFAQAGTCESAAVIIDRATGQSRGFGFVEMSSNAEAEKAIQQFNGHDFKGRALKVNEAIARNDDRRGGGGRRGGSWERRY
jgi:cold-inducible RNA-binding protein